jgi:hypothetical protein
MSAAFGVFVITGAAIASCAIPPHHLFRKRHAEPQPQTWSRSSEEATRQLREGFGPRGCSSEYGALL